MYRPGLTKGFNTIRIASAQIIRDNDPELILETVFTGLRELDDGFHVFTGMSTPSIVGARAALQSTQWSMHPTSVLKRAQTLFLFLRRVTSTLADITLEADKLRRFDAMTTQLEDLLKALDYGMHEVFPTNAPYVTALFAQFHAPQISFQPVLTEQVLLSFLLHLLSLSLTITPAWNQSKTLARRLSEAASGVNRTTSRERLINVFDLLVQLIVERSKVCRNVLIGGASMARIWHQILRVSLGDGIGPRNAPRILRGILTSFREWLEESFFYFQVAEQRNECTRLIEVNL